jgi:hypothetical protein
MTSCSLPSVTSRAEWFLFTDATKLALCNETLLLDMVVNSAINDDAARTVLRACSADYNSDVKVAFVAEEGKASLCTTANRVLEETSVFLHQPQAGADNEFSVNHLLLAGRQIANHLALQEPSCTNNAMEFAYSQSSSIGLFAGAEVHQHGITKVVLEKLLKYAQDKAVSKTTVVQVSANLPSRCNTVTDMGTLAMWIRRPWGRLCFRNCGHKCKESRLCSGSC